LFLILFQHFAVHLANEKVIIKQKPAPQKQGRHKGRHKGEAQGEARGRPKAKDAKDAKEY
jgi:hypothetical protein